MQGECLPPTYVIQRPNVTAFTQLNMFNISLLLYKKKLPSYPLLSLTLVTTHPQVLTAAIILWMQIHGQYFVSILIVYNKYITKCCFSVFIIKSRILHYFRLSNMNLIKFWWFVWKIIRIIFNVSSNWDLKITHLADLITCLVSIYWIIKKIKTTFLNFCLTRFKVKGRCKIHGQIWLNNL